MSMGKKIAQLREEKDLSQRDLAKKIGVHHQSVGRWERDEGVPDSNDLKKIAELFQVATDYLIFDDVPRDGKVSIEDMELMGLFESAAQMIEDDRTTIKKFLKAFVLKQKLTSELASDFKPPTKAKR